ncbi:MAG TPA: hypothetical protein VGN11_00225 [Candidatus Baltobacteraceae bacterium]|jgi:hypothetical protein|nr:hypothetical protein [Candidatus Baltobacteraceae bacterium]
MGHRAFVLSLLASILAAAPAWSAPEASLPAYALIHGVLQASINTKTATVGQKVTLAVVAPYANEKLRGATIVGHITFVQRAGRGTNPDLRAVSDRMVFANGSSSPLSAQVAGQVQGHQNGCSAARTAGGALAGMAVGNMIGKSVFHGNWGGATGAVTGGALAHNRRQDVTIPAGTKIDLELSKPLGLKG